MVAEWPRNYQHDAGNKITTFATGESWSFSGSGGSGAFVTSPAIGDRGARLTCTTSSSSTAIATQTGMSFSVSKPFLTVAFYVHACNDNDTIRVSTSTDDYASKERYADISLRAIRAGWNYLTICGIAGPLTSGQETTGVGGDVFSGAKTAVRFTLTNTNGGIASDVTIGGLWDGRKARAKAVLVFDDGFQSQYDEAFLYLNPLGIKATIGVAADYVGGTSVGGFPYMTSSTLDTIYAAGWDIATHGDVNHTGSSPNLANSLSAITTEVARNRDYLITRGWTRAAFHYVYPGGLVGSNSEAALTACGMLTGRKVLSGRETTYDGLANPLQLLAYSIDSGNSVNAMKGQIMKTIITGGTVFLYGHRVVNALGGDSSNEETVTNWRSKMDYLNLCRSQGMIDVVTVSNWYLGLTQPTLVA